MSITNAVVMSVMWISCAVVAMKYGPIVLNFPVVATVFICFISI